MSDIQAQCWICPQCYDDKHHEPGDFHCLRQQLEASEARRAELEDICTNIHRDLSIRAEPHDWDNPNSAKVVNLSAGYWDQLNSVLSKEQKMPGLSADAWLLRQKAEAVDKVNRRLTALSEETHGSMNAKVVTQYCASVAGEEAQSLRQQADEIEAGK